MALLTKEQLQERFKLSREKQAKKKEAEWITETDANGEEKKYLALTQAGMEIDTNA